jgi:class 3 adenylate cyclase
MEHPVNCQTCGFANVTVARFCSNCGKALAACNSFEPEAERRHLCVLFCDLVGSTPLSQQLDAEDLRIVVRSYQRACEAVVIRNDGFVAQYRGDSIDVYFGYPLAHEDDTSRVVRCALEMVEAVRQLAIATRVDLQVRIGIHSGRVVVGTLGGPDRSERWAVGDTPNIAARIQAEAAPGEVIVSGAFQQLLPRTIAVEPIGFRKLKGVERPVELFKVVAAGGRAAGLNRPRTPFLGRAGERKRVQEIWERAKSGASQFILFRGEPGIGKSRLIEQVRYEIADDNTDVLVARCTPITADTAFYPVIELIGLRLGFEGAPPQERVARIARRMAELGLAPEEAVPLLSSVLSVPVDPSVWPAPDLSPVRARQRTMDIIITALHALTRHGPVLFTVEDLHWADPSTIELLRQLIASSQSASLMALLTARPEFKPMWAAATNVTEIELEALVAAETETFIRKVARDKPLPLDVVWQIRERAAGNPLFLEEITRSVTESGVLVERETAWELVGTLSAGVVPASMEASLMARMDRLGEARSLLQLGATLGREFSYDLLVAVAQSPEDTVRRQLDLMLESGLVFRHGHAWPIYTFKHAVVRDAAYNSLLRTTRQRYHAQIAEVLAARFSVAVQNRPELLAHHLQGAGFHAEAAAQWQAAGENAAKRSAVNEAVAHFRRALLALEQLPEDTARKDRELAILTALAPVLMAVYGWAAPEVGDTCRRAIELAGGLGAHDKMYPPLWGLWTNQFVGGRLREAMDTATRVLAMALATGDPMLEMTAHHAASYTRYYRGEYDASIAEAEAGLRHYTNDREHLIVQTFQLSSSICSMTAKASSLWMQGRQNEGIALMDEMLALARNLRHPPSIAAALAFMLHFFFYDRDWKRLLAMAEESYNLSQAEGFAMWTAHAGMYRGRAHVGLGQVDVGVAEVLEWGALLRQTGTTISVGSTTTMVCEAMHMAGRSEEALAVSREGEQRAKMGLVGAMLPELYRARGNILRDLDHLDQADEAYNLAMTCARAQGACSLELRALTSLLDLHLKRGQPGALPAELLRAMGAMMCPSDRPDLITARDLVARVRS